MNSGGSIVCRYSISIGDNVIIGENVHLYDHNHCFKDLLKPISQQGYKYGEIMIGNNVWLCSNVIILPNVHIGDNCVIGAGCIISDNVPSNSIVRVNQEQIIQKIINDNSEQISNNN